LFPLASDAPHHLLLAGGIGITPLLSMAEVLHRDGRPFALHACARSTARLPFQARLATAPWSRQVRVHIDGPDGPSHSLDALVAGAPAGSHVYACGPAGFIEAARRACEAAGFGAGRFHSESFSALPVGASGNDGLEVEINDGRVFRVAADQSVAQCLEAHGVFIPLSCEQGICGTCVTRVRAGIPDHRDQFLTDEERSSGALFTPCCSRSLTPRLVLDLDGGGAVRRMGHRRPAAPVEPWTCARSPISCRQANSAASPVPPWCWTWTSLRSAARCGCWKWNWASRGWSATAAASPRPKPGGCCSSVAAACCT